MTSIFDNYIANNVTSIFDQRKKPLIYKSLNKYYVILNITLNVNLFNQIISCILIE